MSREERLLKRPRGRPPGSRKKNDGWDVDEALAVLHGAAQELENRQASRWGIIRRAAKLLYPAIYGSADYATALQGVKSETDKAILNAQIEALHRRLDREQEAVDYQHMVAVENAYECCTDLKHEFGDEVYSYDDATRYYELLDDAFCQFPVLPQGFHPTVVRLWGMKTTS